MAAVRLSDEEAFDLDRRRGSLDRGAFLRYLLLKARKDGTSFGGVQTPFDTR